MILDDDPRWRRFNDTKQPCPCCGKSFNGVFDIGYDHPDPWPHGNRAASGRNILKAGDDELGADLCQLGTYRFVRCILPFPIIGTDQRFAFGPWGSVNPENFDRYVQDESGFEGCFAWLTNRLAWIDNKDPLPCNLIPEGDGLRPRLEIHDGHQAARLQDEGITFDQLLDIYAAAGQDVRPHLVTH